MATIFYPTPAATAPYVPDISWANDVVDPFDASALDWSEMIASTPEEWSGVGLNLPFEDDDHRITCLATGAAGAEVIIAAFPHDGSIAGAQFAPVAIPAGTRLSVAAVGTTTVTRPAQIWGLTTADAGGASSFTRADAGPFKLNDSGDQTYDWLLLATPGTADTFAAWTEISRTATTAEVNNNVLNGDSLDHAYAFLMPMLELADTASNTNVDMVFQLAVGAAGSEVVVSEWTKKYDSNRPSIRNLWFRTPLPLVWGHPAGSRVSVRYKASTVAVNVAPKIILVGIR